MSRNSLHRPRRPRAVWDRPAHGTRLLPNPFPPPGDGRSIDSTRHTSSQGPSRGYAPFQGLCPDFVGSPEAIAPRVYSPVASLGTPLSHGDGKEVAPDPLRTVESVWGSYPFLDSPVFPLGEPPTPRDGRGSALPSLRLVERFPHTDRHEVPFRPVPPRVWRRLVPQPVRPRHGPSIACPSLPTDPSSFTVTPAPESQSKMRQGVNPWAGIPLALSGVEGKGRAGGSPRLPIRRTHPQTPQPLPQFTPGVIQSKQLRIQSSPINVQSTINQDQSFVNQDQSFVNQVRSNSIVAHHSSPRLPLRPHPQP